MIWSYNLEAGNKIKFTETSEIYIVGEVATETFSARKSTVRDVPRNYTSYLHMWVIPL